MKTDEYTRAAAGAISEDQPDITFVLYFPFQFYFYKNIYRALGGRAEFVIDLCHDLSAEEEIRLITDLVALVESIGGRYRVLTKDHYRTRGAVGKFFAATACLVSTWEKGCVIHPEVASLRKVRLAYGVAKELTMVRPSGLIYDLVLAHGPRDAANFGLLAPTIQVGIPKFDDWFLGTVASLPQTIVDRLQPGRRTILYAPTHSDLSSLEALVPVLPKLAEIYNVIVRLHYATARAEQSRCQTQLSNNLILVDDQSDILSQFAVADIVLSDNSSTIFEAVLADVPVLVADLWSTEYFEQVHAAPRAQFGGIQGTLTYPDSLEQVVKREGQVPTFRSVVNLEAEIERVLSADAEYARERKLLRSQLFPHDAGESGLRAATVIEQFLAGELSVSRPIMAYALEAQQRQRKELTSNQVRALASEVSQLRREMDSSTVLPRVSVVWVCETAPSNWKDRLKTLCTQTYPTARYELLVVTDDVSGVEEASADLAKLVSLPLVRVLSKSGATVDIIRTIQGLSADYVAYVSSETAVSTEWLMLCHVWFGHEGIKLIHGSANGGPGVYTTSHQSINQALSTQLLWWYSGLGFFNRQVSQSASPTEVLYQLITAAAREGSIVTVYDRVLVGEEISSAALAQLWARSGGGWWVLALAKLREHDRLGFVVALVVFGLTRLRGRLGRR